MDEKPPNNKETKQETSAVKEKLISSFHATGIYPFDRKRVLKRLPQEGSVPDVENVVRDQLTQFLKEQLKETEKASELARKKKRLQIEAAPVISTVNVPQDPVDQVEAEQNISTQNEPLDPEEQDKPDRHDDDCQSENSYNNRGPQNR
ncbi:hypothetical protein O0L34_g6690 [Tuta absoluta]|nr:hypothetical protein O0L34_g6690 [Tuta absoluta]